ncbi:MAG: transporter substrate-binding domain-containing protein [Sphaerochaetaceae bacterium]
MGARPTAWTTKGFTRIVLLIAVPLLVGIVWIATEPLRNTIRTTPEDAVSPTTAVELSLNERAYLDALGPARMAVDPDWEPYEVIAAGKYVGIAADLIRLISTRLGMDIELVVTRDWDESLEASRDGRVHMLAFLNQTPERETWLYFTEPYFKDQNVLITRIEHDYIADAAGLSGETIALPSGTSIQERLQNEYPNLGIVVVRNEAEAFEAVENRTADMALRSLTMAAYTIRKEGLFNLKVAGQLPGFENQFRIGVVKSEPMLRTILNKGVATITAQDVQQAINNHLPIEMRTEVNYNLILWLSSIFFLLLAGGLLWNYFLTRINRQLHEQDVALKQSQEMMGYIIEHNKSAVAVLDHQLRFNYVSQKYLELFKLQGSLIHRFLHDVHPGLNDYWYQVLQKALAGQVANGEEDLFIHSDGTSDYLRWETRPWFLVDGTIGGIIIYAENISGRKEAESALQASEEKFRLLTEYTSDVIWILNMRSRRFSYISPSVEQLRGYSVEEAMEQDLQDSLAPDSYAMVMKAFPRVLKEFVHNPKKPKTHYAEVQQPCKDGSVIWVEFSMKYRLNKTGEIEAIGVSRNIEERKRAEERIRFLSYHDQLTGLYNRRYYEELLPAIDVPENYPLSLVMADVNGLKLANDTQGHQVGDAMLTVVADMLQRMCSEHDMVARIGGDEYVLLMPNTRADEVEQRISHVDMHLRNHMVGSLRLSVAFGWATKDAVDKSLPEIFKEAEDMMYTRKRLERSSRIFCQD